MTTLVNHKFDFGETVYLVTDPDQIPYKIIQINVRPGGNIVYVLSNYAGDKLMYEFELCNEENVVLKMKNV